MRVWQEDSVVALLTCDMEVRYITGKVQIRIEARCCTDQVAVGPTRGMPMFMNSYRYTRYSVQSYSVQSLVGNMALCVWL